MANQLEALLRKAYAHRALIHHIALTCFFFLMLQKIAVEGALDIRFFYSGEDALKLFASLDKIQRENYLLQAVVDLFFILFYSLLFFRISKLLDARGDGGRSSSLTLVPGFLDLIETLTIVAVLNSYWTPTQLDWLGYVTAAKWITVVLVFFFLAWGVGRKFHANARSKL